MKESFQISSVNLDSGLVKEAFSQERLDTCVESNMNLVSRFLEHIHFPQSILCTVCSRHKYLAKWILE